MSIPVNSCFIRPPKADVIFSNWQKGKKDVPDNIGVLATSTEFKNSATKYIYAYARETNDAEAINLAFEVHDKMPSGFEIRSTLLSSILDIAKKIKDRQGALIHAANKAVINVYIRAPHESRNEMIAMLMAPTGGEHGEAYRMARSLKYPSESQKVPALPAPT